MLIIGRKTHSGRMDVTGETTQVKSMLKGTAVTCFKNRAGLAGVFISFWFKADKQSEGFTVNSIWRCRVYAPVKGKLLASVVFEDFSGGDSRPTSAVVRPRAGR